ncbi:hypothetical protein ACVWWG_007105 [Bradyrhizobium sp. LB7.2]
MTTHNRARILTTKTESSRKSDAHTPGFSTRTTYITIKNNFGNATSRAAIIAKRLSAQSKQWRNAMSVFRILIAAALLSTATISSASAAWSFADQEPAAFASMYPRSRRAEWWRADAGRANGPRAARWRRARLRRGPPSQPQLAPMTEHGNRASCVLPGANDGVRSPGVRPRHAAHLPASKQGRSHRFRQLQNLTVLRHLETCNALAILARPRHGKHSPD